MLRAHPRVWVYADEIYSKLVYDGEFVSIASLPGMRERTIICDGASKTYAMTGWRIGFAANAILATGIYPLDHEHRIVRLADQPVGGTAGADRPASRCRCDAAALPRAP